MIAETTELESGSPWDDEPTGQGAQPMVAWAAKKSTKPKGLQLSLTEMFFIVTLAAFAIGLYVYVSRWLVIAGFGGVVVLQIVRMFRPRYAVVGGVIGFIAAIIVSLLTCLIFGVSGPWTLAATLCASPIAYLLGAITAELSYDESL